MRIQVNHIGKMEGHTDFLGEIIKGDVKSAKMITTEGARLIEGILVGRNFSEAPIITSRICGICPVVHKVSSIKAIERAFAITPSEQTLKLRRLMLMAQIIHSHAMHLFFLSLPDFFNLENDLDFISKYKKETNCAMNLRSWGLRIVEVVGGRAVHPIACEVGGFKVLPTRAELNNLLVQYEEAVKNSLVLINMTLKVKLPKFNRPTTFVSLKKAGEYALYEGDLFILKSDGNNRVVPYHKFTKNIKEIEVPYRAAKSATLDGEAFMVGALARLNINSEFLHPLAKGIFKKLNWKLPEYNTFKNVVAQAIEILHCVEEAKILLDDLVKNLKAEDSKIKNLGLIASANPTGNDSYGADAVEAPRGTLYHSYKISKSGVITDCQIITPTVSFLKNLEEDIALYLPNLMKLSKKKRSLKIRSLIRAYDPCISCATH